MDFLWDCALSDPPSKDRKWLIPDVDDLLPPDGNKNGNRFDQAAISSSWTLQASTVSEKDNSIVVPIIEERGRGAWDAVGGEVWEASLLLASFLQSIQSPLQPTDNVLELGCGVALPSLLLWSTHSREGLGGAITISDHDECLLHNLESNISANMTARSLHEDATYSNDLSLIIASLDWSLFDHRMDACALDAMLPRQLRRDQFDIIYGSALCYTTGHSCLAYLIRYYLSGRCREVIVIQIKDREGFAELISELDKMHLRYSLEDILEDVFNQAQRISYQKGVVTEQSGDASKQLRHYKFPVNSTGKEFGKAGFVRTDRQAFGLLRVLRDRHQKSSLS